MTSESGRNVGAKTAGENRKSLTANAVSQNPQRRRASWACVRSVPNYTVSSHNVLIHNNRLPHGLVRNCTHPYVTPTALGANRAFAIFSPFIEVTA